MASGQLKLRAFRFFDLPPQLRNMVYDNLKEHDEPECWAKSAFVTVERLPPHLRLVSRRLQEEAETQITKSITMSIHCWSFPYKYRARTAPPPEHPRKVNRHANKVSNLAITLPILCSEKKCNGDGCGIAQGVAHHGFWFRRLISKLSNLKKVEIEFHIEWPKNIGICWPAFPHGRKFLYQLDNFVNRTPFLENLMVFACRRDLTSRSWLTPRGLWIRWSKGGGWHAPGTGELGPSIMRDESEGESNEASNGDNDDSDSNSDSEETENEGEDLDEDEE